MARFDYIYQAISLGGERRKVMEGTGSEQELPAKCIAIVPSNEGCIISSLKQTGSSTNIATDDFAGKDLASYNCPLCPDGLVDGVIKYFTYITMPVGNKCLAICESV